MVEPGCRVADSKRVIDFNTFEPVINNSWKFCYVSQSISDCGLLCINHEKEHVIVCPRKREWYHPGVLSSAGFFDKNTCIKPLSFHYQHPSFNTHCFVCVGDRVNVISKSTFDFSKCSIINGNFRFMKDYSNIKKFVKKMLNSSTALLNNIRLLVASDNMEEDWEKKLTAIEIFGTLDAYQKCKDMNDGDLWKEINKCHKKGNLSHSIQMAKNDLLKRKWGNDNDDDNEEEGASSKKKVCCEKTPIDVVGADKVCKKELDATSEVNFEKKLNKVDSMENLMIELYGNEKIETEKIKEPEKEETVYDIGAVNATETTPDNDVEKSFSENVIAEEVV